jgi:hypothetical protein
MGYIQKSKLSKYYNQIEEEKKNKSFPESGWINE